MQKCRKSLCILLLSALLTTVFATQAFAAGLLDTGKLAIQSRYGTTDPKPVAGMTFSVYRIADVTDGPKFMPVDSFRDYPVDLEGETAKDWDGIAQVLVGYVQKDHIEATASAVSDADGRAEMKLARGLYLVIGQNCRIGQYTYKVSPAIVCIPNITEGAWNYDVTVIPKMTRSGGGGGGDVPPSPPQKETVDRKALKIWEDDGNEEKRPDSITVFLLRNGEVFKTVKLNETNGWSCEWRGLAAYDANGDEYEWNVVEDPVEGYDVTLEQAGITFVLTNTYTEDIPEEEPPLGPPPETPDEPLEELPEDPVPLAGLPRTGVLWWPVPALLCLGVMFLTVGTVLRRREEA